MRWFTHQITGVGLAAVTVAALNANQTMAAATLGVAWVGSMLPDADQAGARVYRKTLVERHVPLRALTGALARLPIRLLARLPHRGLTHSLPACALAALLCGLFVSLAEPAPRHRRRRRCRHRLRHPRRRRRLHTRGRPRVGAALAQSTPGCCRQEHASGPAAPTSI